MASIGEALEQIKIAQELARDESVLLTFPEPTISEDLENSAKFLRDAQRKLRPFMPQETNPALEDIFGSLGDILNPLTIRP